MPVESNCEKRGCIHFVGVADNGQVFCEAFPRGIPNEIAYGDNPHLEPYSGDRGIQFEEVDARWRDLAVVWGSDQAE